MIDKLIGVALRNRMLVLVFTAAIAFTGWRAYRSLPVDAFPDVTPTMVQIFTESPGLSPVDIEAQISYPVEVAMYGLPGLTRVQSTSIFGLSRVNIYFEDGTDIFFARRLVMERLDEAVEDIPEGLGEPGMGPLTTGLGEVFMYELRNAGGGEWTPMELRDAQDWIVKPMLRTVPGVTEVLSVGGQERQFQVRLDPRALLARNLTVDEVVEALEANNRNIGASFILRGGEEYVVRGVGWYRSGDDGLDDLRSVVLSSEHGTPVTVADVAEVGFGAAVRRGTVVVNGTDSVAAYVLKLYGADTREVLDNIEDKLDAIDMALPDGMELVPFYSQGHLVDKALGTVTTALLEGALLVLVLLYLFLANVRSTLIVIVTLPLSALVAFIGMLQIGLTANLMSLGGLAIGIGMMVDGAVVVVENIFRHLEERSDEEDLSLTRLVYEATSEVGRPVVFSISIIVIVFLPLFTLEGVEGKMFSPMAWAISFALVAALVFALTLVPVVSSFVFSRRVAHGEPRLVRMLKRAYRPVVSGALSHPVLVVGVAVTALLGSMVIVPFLGTEFVPTLREGSLLIRSVLPPGADLTSSIQYSARIAKTLEQFPEVTYTAARVGRAEVGGDPEPVNVVANLVNLAPLDEWETGRSYEELQSDIAKQLALEIPGLASNISQPIQLRTDELMSGIRAQVVVSIFGEDLDELSRLGQEVAAVVDEVEGAVDVRVQQQGGKKQISVTPDRARLARLGVSTDELLGAIETGVGGTVAGEVFQGIRRYPIFVRLAEDQRNRIDLVRQLPIRTGDGALMPLSQVADIDVFEGPKMISRNKASRRLFVQLNVRGRDMGSVVAEIQEGLKERVDLPPGYWFEYGGQFESQQRAMGRLAIVVPLTLSLIFGMLYTMFGSLRHAGIIFINVPFAASGGVVALLVTGQYLSVPAAVGFIAVFGVAVLNGVVMVDYFNQLRRRGLEIREAVCIGAEHRLRPVLMTASVAILGLVPLLLADDIGSNVQRPLAAVVVGGLLTSTLLTLVVLPVIYVLLSGGTAKEVEDEWVMPE